MAGKFVVTKRDNGKYHFNLKAGNGEIILSSQMYTTKSGAMNGVDSVKTNGVVEARFDKRSSSKDQPYFVLKAGNGEIIGTSEMYTSTSGRDNGIASVMKNSADAKVDDSAAD
jgi:uncharacterized protein